MADPIELHRPPRAEVSLTQRELEEVLDELRHVQPLPETDLSSAHNKLEQALAIESSLGGKFWTGGSAA